VKLVSLSGGKDSVATLLVALERNDKCQIMAAFCDTGNEHPQTYDYVRFLEERLGVPIRWLKMDFSERMAKKKQKLLAIANGGKDYWPSSKFPWTPETAAIAAEMLEPTGNPFLDLCLMKGRFPSRTAQFCTQELKTIPLTEYAMELIDQHGEVESWQGVRAEESAKRAKLPEREDCGGGLTIYRPILHWTVEQVFDKHRDHGIEPNPLYKQGMNRVGCMPCINAGKDEILEISKRFPEQIKRIAEWEKIVAKASRSGFPTFFPSPGGDTETATERGGIEKVVEWSKTKRGGREQDWLRAFEEPKACSSSYGLCE